MITTETIQSTSKEDIATLTPTLGPAEVGQLVEWLTETDDNFRYKCFLLLQARSQAAADVYPYWDVFADKLASENSYQRSLGLMLIAENARWDHESRFADMTDHYLSFCDDEKPVTVRQCIQSLCKVVPYQSPETLNRIIDKLISIEIMERKETQRKILLMDILSVLAEIQKRQPDDKIMQYFQTAITGAVLDSKSKKTATAMIS